MRQSLLAVFLLLFGYLLTAELLLSSCATRSSPGGGPRDTIAPVLDTSYPANLTTNFSGNRVRLLFDEYINLKGGNKQINFSPPLEEPPTINARGREIIISWKDSLRKQTTYTISFGSSITDIRENNENTDFKYIFSTGDFIDSLQIAGHVINALNSQPEEKLLVALYETADTLSNDSLPFKKLPTYYAYTDEEGHFDINYMKYGEFLLIAFKDARGNFKLSNGNEKIAFHSEIIKTKPEMEELLLQASEPLPSRRFKGARMLNPGHIQLTFSRPVEEFSLNPLAPQRLSRYFSNFNNKRDTINFWFQPFLTDSLRLIYSEASLGSDTVVVNLREMNTPELKLKAMRHEIRIFDPIVLKSNFPLDSLAADAIAVYSSKDTLSVSLEEDTTAGPLILKLRPSQPAKKYRLMIPPSAVSSPFAKLEDTIAMEVKTLSREDLGNVDFKVKAASPHALVLVIRGNKGREIIRREFRDSVKVQMKSQQPGAYTAELIVDRNGDGEWSPGNFMERRQPERIFSYQETIEVRANWDLELEWIAKLDAPLKRPEPKDSKEDAKEKNLKPQETGQGRKKVK